jgi:hypothetical protein
MLASVSHGARTHNSRKLFEKGMGMGLGEDGGRCQGMGRDGGGMGRLPHKREKTTTQKNETKKGPALLAHPTTSPRALKE